jgi:hypothetical protein
MAVSAEALVRGFIDVGPASNAARAPRLVSATACVGVCFLVLAVPFETRSPLVRMPGQELSSAELAVGLSLAGWIAAALWCRAAIASHPVARPWMMFLVVMAVAAAVSSNAVNAAHMVGRLALGFAVFLMTAHAVSRPGRHRVIAAAIVSGACVAAVLVVLEYFGSGPVMRGLRLFRSGVALVGAQVRAGGPFQYPTIAAMSLEIAFALGLGLLAMAIDERRRRPVIAIVTAATLLIAQAITLTFTRAGLLTMAACLGMMAWRRWRQHGVDVAVKLFVLIAVAVAVQLVASRSLESLRLRLITEGQESWYGADIVAPRELTMAARSRMTVPVTLTNTGGNTWDPFAPQPFRLSYHWLLADADRVVSWEGLRTDFAAPVGPGESVSMLALVEAPRHPGRYRLLWDIEQQHRLWFSTEPDSTLAISRATISGDASLLDGPISTIPMPGRAVRPGRLVLWRAAVRLLAGRPLLGIGPDNYRLLYGEAAGIVPADTRIHSNNMYVEVLVWGGIAGGLVFVWLLWTMLGAVRHRLRHADPADAALAAGAAAACLAVVVHGVFDCFLSFTPTYVLISVALGLAATPYGSPRITHAHRL